MAPPRHSSSQVTLSNATSDVFKGVLLQMESPGQPSNCDQIDSDMVDVTLQGFEKGCNGEQHREISDLKYRAADVTDRAPQIRVLDARLRRPSANSFVLLLPPYRRGRCVWYRHAHGFRLLFRDGEPKCTTHFDDHMHHLI